MVSTTQTGVGISIASIHSRDPIGMVSAPSYHSEVDAIAIPAIGSRIGIHSGGPLSWMQPLRAASIWEVTMVAVLFLLVSGLVGIRLADMLSERDVGVASIPLPTQATTESDESTDSRTDDHLGYERYLSPETPPELLSDEGKVVRLLVANQGRIRQHQIADETGWSKSKVSRICSQMDADGTIEKSSVGRENVITLAESDPDDETRSEEVENPLP
ncbi:helix-turn-helix transcriptional regulator [Halosolutus amylolyticus]|uniref:Helix-turn-helix transcriptional regulator n=1 Tax=Halosolutus amylolyticus TaxID=2932267 RepID=A0ABD5PVR5_9EURY|nr:MarR family transcriptional regulator [Halosolutus amylolyticus]